MLYTRYEAICVWINTRRRIVAANEVRTQEPCQTIVQWRGETSPRRRTRSFPGSVRPSLTAKLSPGWSYASKPTTPTRQVCASEVCENRGYNHLQLELLHLPVEVFRDEYVPRGRLELERLLGAHLELIGLLLQPPLKEVHARVEKRLDGVWYIP